MIGFFFTNEASNLAPQFWQASIPSKSEVLGCLKKAPWKSFQSENSTASSVTCHCCFWPFFSPLACVCLGGSARNQYRIISFNTHFSHSHVKAWSPNAATLGPA